MNRNTKRISTKRTRSNQPAQSPSSLGIMGDDLAALTAQAMIAHATIPGFMRRIPHHWQLDDITRFGNQVGRAAESMQLAYITTVDRNLGTIRVFPCPLLERIYTLMAPQHNWPQIIDANMPAIEDSRAVQREALRKRERADKDLGEIVETADNVEVLSAAQTVRDYLHADIERLRHEIETPPSAPSAPLAVV